MRPYTLKRRAESMEATRRRIARAAVELHAEVGPASTTIAAIARRAGVQRETVYRHFPDELSLYRACFDQWTTEHPLPNPTPWRDIAEPERRLRVALAEVYAFYRRVEPLFARGVLDMPKLPKLQEADAPMFEHWERMRRVLAVGWGARRARRRRLLAALGLALDFQTWQLLVGREGATDAEALDVAVGLVASAATGRAPGRSRRQLHRSRRP